MLVLIMSRGIKAPLVLSQKNDNWDQKKVEVSGNLFRPYSRHFNQED
jgi:hypothetical protein